MDYLNSIFKRVSDFMWGPCTIALILGISIFITLSNRFFHVFYFRDVLKNTIGSIFQKNSGDQKGISSFQAVSTALAGSIGTGNIFGVAAALFFGGPGAIFWMWVSAFFGMMLKYAEVVLSIKYRMSDENGFYGGPMYVMEKGLNLKFMGRMFAIFCVLASFGIGSTVQANCAANALATGFSMPKILSSVLMVGVCAIVLIGGIKRLGNMAATVVPLMSVTYILISFFVLFCYAKNIPSAFFSIFNGAFNLRSTVSGGVGYLMVEAMRNGISKSVFVSEAGLGSSPIAHSASNVRSAVRQGQWGIFEVFFNTIIMCTMTALVILVTGVLGFCNEEEEVTLAAFSTVYGSFSDIVLAVCTALFAFTTIISWSYYGEQATKYLFGDGHFVNIYKVIYILSVGIGGICKMDLVFNIANIFNLLMSVPNLLAIVFLSPELSKLTSDYKSSLKCTDDG